MVSWFKPFGKGPSERGLMDAEQFTAHVLALLRQRFPQQGFTSQGSLYVVSSSGGQFGLQNLYAKYRLAQPSDSGFDDALLDHFARILPEFDADALGWDQIRGLLRVQVMPAEYRQQAPLLTFPLLDDVLIGLVVDSEKAYRYVREEDADLWGQSPDDLYDLAVQNLGEASAGIAMSFVPPPHALIAIETKDSYDAARILVPGIRAFAAEKLGEPFFAGIPNRDFLIMWSRANPPDFQVFTREKLAKDFSEQPYPLTATTLSVSTSGISATE